MGDESMLPTGCFQHLLCSKVCHLITECVFTEGARTVCLKDGYFFTPKIVDVLFMPVIIVPGVPDGEAVKQINNSIN